MTPETIALNLLGLFLLVGVGLLFAGGRLVRRDLHDKARRRSRLLEDLRPLQDLTVDFFARAEPYGRILAFLAGHRQAVAAKALFHEAQPAGKHDPVSRFGIEGVALWMMRMAGLVSLEKHGLLLTDTGREVYRRIRSASLHPGSDLRPCRESGHNKLFIRLPTDDDAASHLRQVPRSDIHAPVS
jgi:hypothetical protein